MASINNELQYINRMAREDPRALVEKSEERYRAIVKNIAARAMRAEGHKLILLAGPSASGKTTTAQKLAEALGRAGPATFRVSMDDFYLPAGEIPLLPDGSRDIESVHAIDLPLLRETLRELMEDGRGTLPVYNFGTGRRETGETLRLGKEDMIVLEGLHALNPLLTESLAEEHIRPDQMTKVYISVSSRIYDGKEIVLRKRSLRLTRRILRDDQFRQARAEATLFMWPAVTRGEEQWLTPCKPNADALINSIHVYEPCVFRNRLLPLLKEIYAGGDDGDHPAGGAAYRLARALEQFEPMAEDLVPGDSLLREFLGGG